MAAIVYVRACHQRLRFDKSGARRMTEETVPTFDTVWDALKEMPEEAANMRLRSELMTAVRNTVEGWHQTQAQAAKRLGITQTEVERSDAWPDCQVQSGCADCPRGTVRAIGAYGYRPGVRVSRRMGFASQFRRNVVVKHIACSRHRSARPHAKSDAGSQTRALRRRRDLISRVGHHANRHELNVPRGLIPTEKCSPHS